jgi:hypothetical protein
MSELWELLLMVLLIAVAAIGVTFGAIAAVVFAFVWPVAYAIRMVVGGC